MVEGEAAGGRELVDLRIVFAPVADSGHLM